MKQYVWLFLLCAGLTLARPAAIQLTCDETEGRVERPGYRSTLIDTNMVYSIYLPPCYDQSPEQVYPTIYLLHGSNDDDNHWLRLGLKEILDTRISTGEMPPLIVVLPFGNWIANQNQFGVASWENVFVSELLPLVESSYRIEIRQEYRAIGGISRGGFWAFQIALRHPAMFGAIGGHSGFFDLYHAPDAYNPLDLVLTIPPENAPRIWLDRGAFDYAAPGLDIMDDRLNSANIPHSYTIYPEGEHNNFYWRDHVGEYLDFYVQNWLTPAAPTSEPLFITNTPRPEIEPTASNSTSAKFVMLPAVAFPSRLYTMDSATFEKILRGQHDPKLVLASDVTIELATRGFVVNSLTPIVDADQIYAMLWRDRSLWTILPFDRLTTRYRVLWIDEINPLYDLANYPLAFDSTTPNFDPAKLTRILMSGVTALTRRSMPIFDEKGMTWASEAIAPITTRADFFHTSNEVSMVETCPTAPPGTALLGGGGSFCSKPAYFDVLKHIGVDIVELSGNHNNDYGYDAYRSTLQWYQDNGMRTVGGGIDQTSARQPLILNHNGNSVAWITCNFVGPYYALANDEADPRPGAASCDSTWLAATIPLLKTQHDLVMMTVQYWEFDQHAPTAQQKSDFRYWAELGADVVTGTQAHFAQSYDFAPREADDEAFVHYGLGNFMFDQGWWAGARFFMDELYIYNGQLQFIDVYTGIIEDLGRPRLMTPDERLNFWVVVFEQNSSL